MAAAHSLRRAWPSAFWNCCSALTMRATAPGSAPFFPPPASARTYSSRSLRSDRVSCACESRVKIWAESWRTSGSASASLSGWQPFACSTKALRTSPVDAPRATPSACEVVAPRELLEPRAQILELARAHRGRGQGDRGGRALDLDRSDAPEREERGQELARQLVDRRGLLQAREQRACAQALRDGLERNRPALHAAAEVRREDALEDLGIAAQTALEHHALRSPAGELGREPEFRHARLAPRCTGRPGKQVEQLLAGLIGEQAIELWARDRAELDQALALLLARGLRATQRLVQHALVDPACGQQAPAERLARQVRTHQHRLAVAQQQHLVALAVLEVQRAGDSAPPSRSRSRRPRRPAPGRCARRSLPPAAGSSRRGRPGRAHERLLQIRDRERLLEEGPRARLEQRGLLVAAAEHSAHHDHGDAARRLGLLRRCPARRARPSWAGAGRAGSRRGAGAPPPRARAWPSCTVRHT